MPATDMAKPATNHPRIFLGLLDICGFFSTVERGLQELGVEAFFLDMGKDIYGHRSGPSRHPIADFYKATTAWFHRSRSLRRSNPMRYFWTALNLFATGVTLLWIAARFDVIVLKSGHGFAANQVDFRFFRWLGKKLVFTFHGSDARPPFINGIRYSEQPAEWMAERTHQTKAHIDRITKYATWIAYNPLSAHFLKGKVCTIQCLGHAVDMAKMKKAEALAKEKAKRPHDAIRILHAPTAPHLKGTDQIRRLIEKLKSEGHAIDYIEISGQPHATVMEELARCDFVIDELYSDTHGAVFSLEACAFGKPSIVCGYGTEELARFVAEEDVVPTYYCRPEALEEATRKLLLDPALREEMGQRARAFAERRATPRAVAERLLRLVTGKAPSHWFYEPHDIAYLHGIGLSEAEARRSVRKLIDYGGIAALQLGDKPELEQRFKAFAKEETISRPDDEATATKAHASLQ